MLSVSNDVNMRRIVTRLLQTKFGHMDVRLYGLIDKPGRPDVTIECMGRINDTLEYASQILTEGGLRVDIEDECDPEEEFSGLRIGFNRRVRDDVDFSRRLVTMLLHAYNGTLKFDKGVKILRVTPPIQGPQPAPASAVQRAPGPREA